MSEAPEFSRLLNIVRELREKCAWDREQTLPNSSRHLVEEAYETADAIAAGDPAAFAEEAGDLLSQTLFAIVIAAEGGGSDPAAVIKAAADKLVRRHPHVYANAKAETAEQVLAQWDRIKAEEKAAKPGDRSSLSYVGRALPALMRAEKLGEAARRRGMDWANAREVLDKVREELAEAEQALARGDLRELGEETGDMMLALANLPRFIGRDAESVLRASCEKFIMRFAVVEELARERGLDLKALSPVEIESLWQQAKRL